MATFLLVGASLVFCGCSKKPEPAPFQFLQGSSLINGGTETESKGLTEYLVDKPIEEVTKEARSELKGKDGWGEAPQGSIEGSVAFTDHVNLLVLLPGDKEGKNKNDKTCVAYGPFPKD